MQILPNISSGYHILTNNAFFFSLDKGFINLHGGVRDGSNINHRDHPCVQRVGLDEAT
jgi:hypothetical protein